MPAQFREAHPDQEGLVEEVIVVHFPGTNVSLDEETIQGARDQLFALAEEATQSPLLLDFQNVAYLTSATLGALVSLHKDLLAKGRRLTIHNLRPPAHEVFQVTRLDEFLDLRPAEPGAEPAAEGCGPAFSAGVLVVDDDPAVRSILEARLRREGFTVWVAAHGQQAIEPYRRHTEAIAVVLLDVLMPGLDGPRTLLALQNLSPQVRCCFMTGGLGTHREEAVLLRMGAVRVFWKPFDFLDLTDTLTQLTRQPSRHRHRWIEMDTT